LIDGTPKILLLAVDSANDFPRETVSVVKGSGALHEMTRQLSAQVDKTQESNDFRSLRQNGR
jgi:hypothetical protein